MQLFFALAAIIVVINVVFYYVQVDTLATTVESTTNAFRQILPMITSTLGGFISKIQFPGFNVVLAVIGLAGLFLLDRLVLQPRFRASS